MSITTELESGHRIKMEVTELGEIPEGKVTAATDAGGSQVIVKGKKSHLLSRPLRNHNAAVDLGKRIVTAKTTQIYHEWLDLLKGGNGLGLFAIFGGVYRYGTPPPEKVLNKLADAVLGKPSKTAGKKI